MVSLTDVTTIRNRLGDLIEYQEEESTKIETLILMCEKAGAVNTAQRLRLMLSDEVVELTTLQKMEDLFEKEEVRLLSISPESRYPLVSERRSPGIGHEYSGYIVRNGNPIEQKYSGYIARSSGSRYRGRGYTARDNRSRY